MSKLPYLVYIAGALRADTPEGVELNIVKAVNVSAIVNITYAGKFFFCLCSFNDRPNCESYQTSSDV